MHKYALLEEKALINFELLMDYWGIEYKQISPSEYDFINPLRHDENYGACRFNIEKGKGADFAGINFTDRDFRNIGDNFTKDDFNTNSKNLNSSWGFNIIGLCQRLHGCESYKDAAEKLKNDLDILGKNTELVKATKEAIEARQHKIQEARTKKLKMAIKIWGHCGEIKNTIGEKYLQSRNIILQDREPNIKFHPKVMCKEAGAYLPALLFKVETSPGAGICAVHRIYLKPDGSGKAELANPKMALGSISNAGIWFGKPDFTLCIVEGPENSLSIKSIGFKFVVCAISAVNFSTLYLPAYVKDIILFPDKDEAGEKSVAKAKIEYNKQGKKIRVSFPPNIAGIKKPDWNDVLRNMKK